MNRIFFFLLLCITSTGFAQGIMTPSQKINFSRPTSYDELKTFVDNLSRDSKLLKVEIIGESTTGRNLYALKFSNSEFGMDKSKIKILIFAQQHGNEQSGKEGALLLAAELLKPENHYLFKKIDLVIVPQMNPDGSEENKRRNGNGADLNRNHLILSEPETMALHRLFDRYLFEVTMDVHEYYPYGDTWKAFGYRNNSDELLGINTNTNVSSKIRNFSKQSFMPFYKQYLNDRHISNFIYSPGGPPEIDYIRQSTFDINDGRQSFGIQNTVSFIQEGMNGTDSYSDNLEHRALTQMSGMRGLIEESYRDKKELKSLVKEEREKLLCCNQGSLLSIQSEHVADGEKLKLPVYSYYTDKDSVIIVNDYRPVVKSICDVEMPSGYLVPKQLKIITDWIDRQALISEPYVIHAGDRIEQYDILSIGSIDFEEDTIVNPVTSVKDIPLENSSADYIYLPVNQLKGKLLAIALEPKSMLGLVTYKDYSPLLKVGEKYPILRVIKK